MTGFGTRAARAAAEPVRRAMPGVQQPNAIMLGSGLGGLADRVEDAAEFAYADLPGFPASTVSGHGGRLVVGLLAGRAALVFDGRTHEYEGAGPGASAFPVRVAHALGATTVIVTNAAGGIRPALAPGDLMVIRDHINWTFRSPLTGPVEANEERFPDMSAPYDPALAELLLGAACTSAPRTTMGVYAGVLGPSYETRAEVRALARLGADVVGMSTVPEVIVARALGMRVAGMSLVTNMATGLGAPLSHDDVLAVSRRATGTLVTALQSVIHRLATRSD